MIAQFAAPQGVIRDYLALTKPRIIVLLLLTALGGMFLAAGGAPEISLVLAVLGGGALAAGGANALNHWMERDTDRLMSRTSGRPVVAGRVQPSQAFAFGIVLNAVFFLVPIVYPIDIIPEQHWGLPVRKIVEWNPINQFIAAARDSAYLVEWPSATRWLALVGYSTVVFGLGWRFFARRSMQLSEDM